MLGIDETREVCHGSDTNLNYLTKFHGETAPCHVGEEFIWRGPEPEDAGIGFMTLQMT